MQSVKSLELRYLSPAFGGLGLVVADAEVLGKTIVLTIPCRTAETAVSVLTSAYDRMRDEHPVHTEFTDADADRSKRKVNAHIGEAFYRAQDNLITGWELEKPAPAGLVTDQGTAVHRIANSKSHKLKPDREPHAQVSRDIWGL